MRKATPLVLACLVAILAAATALAWFAGRRAQAPAGASTSASASGRGPASLAAAPVAPHKPSTGAAASGSAKAPAAPVWTVDHAASRLTFRALMNGTPFDGVFRTWDAQIAFDPDNLKGSHATVTVDTASALTGQPIKDQALPNGEWLSTARFPTATLVTRQIVRTGPGRYQAGAEVTIRGVRWRTTVPFTVAIAHDVGTVDAKLTLDRRTFGIGEGPFGAPAPVAPSVQVTLHLVARKSR